MNNNLGWNHALGVGFDVPPKGQRYLGSGNGPYTELMHEYELWLRDQKGYTSFEQIDSDKHDKLRTEFFLLYIEIHPEWFSSSPIGKSELMGMKPLSGHSKYNYICTGCQRILSGNYLWTCKH